MRKGGREVERKKGGEKEGHERWKCERREDRKKMKLNEEGRN